MKVRFIDDIVDDAGAVDLGRARSYMTAQLPVAKCECNGPVVLVEIHRRTVTRNRSWCMLGLVCSRCKHETARPVRIPGSAPAPKQRRRR